MRFQKNGKFVIVNKARDSQNAFILKATRLDDQFIFRIPAELFQDGFYYLEEVKITNVKGEDDIFYQSNANLVDADKKNTALFDNATMETGFLTVELTETHKNKTEVKIIKTAYVKDNIGVEGGVNAVYGKNGETVVGKFMESHTVSDIKFTVVDFAGEPIEGVTAVNVTYTLLGNKSKDYGNYTYNGWDRNQISTDLGINVINTTKSGNGEYTANDFNIATAGEYQIHATVVLGDQTVNYNAKKLIEVWSAKPTVTITGVSPGTGTTNRINIAKIENHTLTGNTFVSGAFNRYSEYFAVVYIHTESEADFLTDWNKHNITVPKVTLELSGVTGIQGASMLFNNAADNTYAKTFTFDASTLVATSEFGYGVDGEVKALGTDVMAKVYPAGKQTVNQITIKSGGVDYTVDLSHEVTINQPQYPAYADFKINDSTFTGTTPSRVYSEDGETITLTLPDSSNMTMTWTENKSTTKNEDFVVQSGYPTTKNVYTQRSETSGCDTTNYYTPYIETTTVSKASSSTTTWVNTKTITGWKIGNKVYSPGETITLTGTQTIVAVVSTVEGPKTTVSSTTTRTEIAYTQNGVESTTKPSGSKVTSVEGSVKDVVS